MCVCVCVYFRRPVEGVGVEDGLDHDQRLGLVLPHELVAVVGRLIRTVVEHLEEGRPSQVEHKLGMEAQMGHCVRLAGMLW